jgi:two-component system response regulator CpxR
VDTNWKTRKTEYLIRGSTIPSLSSGRGGDPVRDVIQLLPGMGGLDVLRRLREQSPIPVMILTARGEDVDRILGLEIGADDYLSKPFNPRELIAQIRAILRRTVRVATGTHPLIVGDMRLDRASREAWIQGRMISLTSVEFAPLEMLLQHAGRIVTREELTEAVLGRKLDPSIA